MILNEDTLKEGTTLYYLKALQHDNGTWEIGFYKIKLSHVNLRLSFITAEFPYENRKQWFNEKRIRNWDIAKCDILNNDKPYVVIGKYMERYSYVTYSYLCDSFQTLAKVFKKTVFANGCNEITKRKRQRIYREAVRRWTKSEFKENFYTTIR
jgi:hypothetical protein